MDKNGHFQQSMIAQKFPILFKPIAILGYKDPFVTKPTISRKANAKVSSNRGMSLASSSRRDRPLNDRFNPRQQFDHTAFGYYDVNPINRMRSRSGSKKQNVRN
jgi:hypothetical protein